MVSEGCDAKVDQLCRDAGRLFRLVNQIAAYVREHQGDRTYAPESRAFLEFIESAAKATKEFLEENIGRLCGNNGPSDGRLPARIAFISQIWGRLHNFVEPVVDADTLHIPVSLVALLNRQARALGLQDQPQIAIELASPLNYLQRKHSPLRDLAASLENRLSKKVGFPNGLGIIGLPYSQGPFLFFNCLLFHELGHYYVEQARLVPEIKNRVSGFIKSLSTSGIPAKNYDPDKLFTITRPWFEEVFCDLFAVRLLGPAYTFIFADLFDLVGDLRNEKALQYSRSHPSASIRLKQQIALLRQPETSGGASSWWEWLATARTPLASEIDDVAQKPRAVIPYARDCEGLPIELLDAFESALPQLSSLVTEKLKGRRLALHRFIELSSDFERCLLHAIVPRCVITRNTSPEDEEWCMSLINASYFLQLGNLKSLFELSGRNSSSVEDHAFLRKRLEEWVLKAIGDKLAPELLGLIS